MSSCVDTTALITKLFPPFGRASIIVFELNGHYKNKRTMSSMGRYIYVGQEKFVFSTSFAAYLGNGTRLCIQLLWITNRKSQVADRTVSPSITSSGLEMLGPERLIFFRPISIRVLV